MKFALSIGTIAIALVGIGISAAKADWATLFAWSVVVTSQGQLLVAYWREHDFQKASE